MHLLFPESPLARREPDDLVREQYEAFRRAGFATSLISVEGLQEGGARVSSPPREGAVVLYRGWMLKPKEYKLMESTVSKFGARMHVSLDQYLSAHYLPSWYPLVSAFTAETVVMPKEEATAERIRGLGWSGVFIKDYVKSLKTGGGSRVINAELVAVAIEELRHFRGEIEGGICLRRIENFAANSEKRYFVLDGVPFAPEEGAIIPPLVGEAAQRIPSPFFSVDVAQRDDGEMRLIEVGDGQVSDLVGWTADRFVEIWSKSMLNLSQEDLT